MMPSRNVSSSMVETCCAVCCHLPRGSVNRRSTYSTECSVSISMTLPTPLLPAGLLAMYGFPVLCPGRRAGDPVGNRRELSRAAPCDPFAKWPVYAFPPRAESGFRRYLMSR